VLALATIVVCAALLVLAAADRPSFLSAPSQYGFFPHWLAGPLGGLWPSFTRSPQAVKALFTGALGVMYVAYLVGLRYVPLLRARWAIVAIVGVHAILFLSPPLALTDVFNYINYGRMGVLHHLNPYTTVPVLEPHSDPSFYLSNWHQLLSPYGPLFTLLTRWRRSCWWASTRSCWCGASVATTTTSSRSSSSCSPFTCCCARARRVSHLRCALPRAPRPRPSPSAKTP
jgi:hypothetical protein